MPALLAHRVPDREHVQLRPVHGRERDDGRRRVAQDAQFWDLRTDALRDRLGRADDVLARLQVAAIVRIRLELGSERGSERLTRGPCIAASPKFRQ